MGFGGIKSAQSTINTTATTGEQSIASGQSELNANALSSTEGLQAAAESQQQSLFGAQNQLVQLQSQTNLLGAQLQQKSADQQAGAYYAQGVYAVQYANQQAQVQQIEIDQASSNQAESYLSGGVEMQGTPLAQVNATRALGAIQVGNILQQGQLQAQLDFEQGNQYKEQGQSDILNAMSENTLNQLNLGIQQSQQQMELEQNSEGTDLSLAQQGQQALLQIQQQQIGVQQQGQEANLQIAQAQHQEELGLLTSGLSLGTSLLGIALQPR